MTILTANLKHFYQFRRYIILHIFMTLVLAISAPPIIYSSADALLAPTLIGLFIFEMIGFFLMQMKVEVLFSPFTYSLPNHEKTIRKEITIISLILSFIYAIIYLIPFQVDPLKTIAIFALYLMTFNLGVLARINIYITKLLATLSFVMLLYFIFFSFQESKTPTSQFLSLVLIGNPWIIPISLIFHVIAWRYLTVARITRRFCGLIGIEAKSISFGTNQKKHSHGMLKKSHLDKLRISDNIERFFLNRINCCTPGSIASYLWGAMYKSNGIMLSKSFAEWLFMVCIASIALLFIGYTHNKPEVIVLIISAGIVIHMNLWTHSTLTICGGRKERFLTALSLAVSTALLSAAFFLTVISLLHLIHPYMLDITIRNSTFTFHLIAWWAALLPFIAIPLVLAGHLLIRQGAVLLMLSIVLGIFIGVTLTKTWKTEYAITYLAGSIAISWLIFILILYIKTMYCSLVTNRR